MKNIIVNLFMALLVSIAYAGLFFIPKLPTAKLFGVIQFEHIILLAALSFFIATAAKSQFRFQIIAFVLVCAAFTLPLLRIWQNAESNWSLILGLLPWSDASGYFTDTNSLLDGNLMGGFSGRRPLFPGFLATLLALTGRNLQITLIIMALVTSAAAFLAARQIQHKSNSLAGALSITLLWCYYHHTTGTTLTEQLGLPLGVLAFGILLASLDEKNKFLYALGLFLLTFALFARAGAFFVLPLLALWGIFNFDNPKRSLLQQSILFGLAILIPIIITVGLGRVVTTQDSVPMGNFSYTLYGQVTGGKGWTQVFEDYPEITRLAPGEQMQEIYRLALGHFLQNPRGLLTASVQSWIDYIKPSKFSVYSFLDPYQMKSGIILQILATILLIAGIVVCIFNIKKPLYGMSLAGLAGILLSLPFIPPTDVAFMRAQAATVIWGIWLTAIPLSAIRHRQFSHPPRPAYQPSLIVGVLLVFLATLGPVTLRFIGQPHSHPAGTCPSSETEVRFFVHPGTHITVQESQPTRFPVIDKNVFERSMSAFPGVYYQFSESLMSAQPPFTLTYTRDLSNGSSLWIIGPPTLTTMKGKIVRACVEFIQSSYPIVTIKHFEPIND